MPGSIRRQRTRPKAASRLCRRRAKRRARSMDLTMTAPLKTVERVPDLATLMRGIGQDARAAARTLALALSAKKDRALAGMAQALRAGTADILAANQEDIAEAKAEGATAAFVDRLTLDAKGVAVMADGIEVVR